MGVPMAIVLAVVTMAIVLAVVTIFSFATAGVASGLEPGVHVDPGSPAAKEYALPLNQARGTGSAPAAGQAAATPFGAGIHPGGGSGSGSAGGRPSAQKATHIGATPVSARGPSGSPGTSIVPAAVLRASGEHGSSGGDGSILALVGGGVAVLVLGGLGGIVMRRARRATPLA
jgi:hypothetical protein